jgi:class 3 adenylate cyclase/tetratricopeptide (TPR) repeat protein
MKQVSVLFCDIVNSTAMTERLGPEAMRDLISSFLEASLAEVHRYGGMIPQFTGDGFMALFGAPLAYEDHVHRCLFAALAIQRTLGAVTSEGGRLDLPARFGIHTGPVVFGPLGAKLPNYFTAIGDTANVAARLQQAAEPGTILLSETTRRLAQGFSRLEPVGPLMLKGKNEPIVAWRLLGVLHQRSGLRETGSGHLTTFVDRHSELAILNNSLRQVENGCSRTIGVAGEPGIGKSRLLAEFRQQLARGRVNWVEGRCVSYGTTIPYWLLLDLLRSNCGIVETDTQEAITDKVRSRLHAVGMAPDEDGRVLLHLLGISDIGDSPILSNAEAIKTKAFEVFLYLCVNASTQRPLILAIEDLHWIDQISEEFLGFLAEKAADARILILAAYRPEYHPPWMDKSFGAQAPLQPLSRDDSLQMVRSVLSAERLVDLVTEEIIAKADGNPFFLEQLALHAGEAKDPRSDLMVPDSIHDVMMARIDRLSDQTKQLLQTAAVIGREFSFRLLSAVRKDPGLLETQLRELICLEFVSERPAAEGNTYVFRHALTQEAAYGSLLERHRRSRHEAVGWALEALYSGRTEEVAELLAFHFGRSDQTEKAVDYAILAAEKAQRRWANSEALTYFNDARDRLDRMPDSVPNRLRRIDAVLKQTEVKFALGRHAEHIEALETIRGIVDQTDEPRRRATWYYWTGFLNSITGGRPDVAIEHCREAAAIASAFGLDDIDAFANCCLAQVYTMAGRLRDAIEVGERALAIFEARGNRWWAGRTLGHLTWGANALGEWEASLSYCRRALEHGGALQDLRLKTIGWWRMASAAVQQGDLELGFKCCNEALEIATTPYDIVMTRAVHGYGQIRAGHVDAGMAELREAAEWFESAHLRHPNLRLDLWLAEGHLIRGDRASARPLIEGVLRASGEAGYLYFQGLASWLMGECLAEEAPAAAADWVETAAAILERIEAKNDLANAMITQASLCQRDGDDTTARQLLERAGTIFRALGTREGPAKVEVALGALGRGLQIPLQADD